MVILGSPSLVSPLIISLFDVSSLLSLGSNRLQSYISSLAAWRVVGRALEQAEPKVNSSLQWLEGVVTVGRRLHRAGGWSPVQ